MRDTPTREQGGNRGKFKIGADRSADPHLNTYPSGLALLNFALNTHYFWSVTCRLRNLQEGRDGDRDGVFVLKRRKLEMSTVRWSLFEHSVQVFLSGCFEVRPLSTLNSPELTLLAFDPEFYFDCV